MNKKKFSLRGDGMNSVLASLISIIIGLLAGCVVILICGLTNPTLGLNSAWEGIRLVLAGMFSTGRDAVGALTFGFNPIHMGNLLFRATPLILTGLFPRPAVLGICHSPGHNAPCLSFTTQKKIRHK